VSSKKGWPRTDFNYESKCTVINVPCARKPLHCGTLWMVFVCIPTKMVMPLNKVKFTDDSVGARKTISMYLVAAQTNVTRSNDTFKS